MEVEIEELKLKLKDSESKQFAIAQLAKEILEKDKDKDQRLFSLGEENLQQSMDISRLQALLKTRDEYLADAESEVAKLRNEITEINGTKSAHLIELEQKISCLHAEINEKNDILFEREQEIQELKKTLALKERKLEEASQKPEVSVGKTRDSLSDSELAKLNGKMAELELEKNLMSVEISQLQDKVVTTMQNLNSERNHVEELSMICNSYRRDVEELKNQCNELTYELDEYRSKTKIAKRGNSMFFEFVDERVKLEKDLLKLKCQNDFFASQRQVYELELNELRHELMLALTLNTNEGNAGSDTNMLQSEILRLRTELSTVNAKLLEKYKEGTEAGTGAVGTASIASDMVDMREYALNSLKEEVKMLARKLSRAEEERMEYFDKVRECDIRYAEECRRSNKLSNEVECLKRRLILEQKKSFDHVLSKAFKPSAELLSKEISEFNEKIANINEVSMDEPTISEIQNLIAFPFNCPIVPSSATGHAGHAGPSVREEEIINITTEASTIATTETVMSDTDQNKHLSPTESETQASTGAKEVLVEKRLKFELLDEGTTDQSIMHRKEDVYPRKPKPKRRIMRRVCEAGGL